MVTAFTAYAFPATGAPTSRTMPDRISDIINVKDYGAVGDGVTDDTSAIQLAFNTAYGTSAAPHGSSSAILNKPVFFPAGVYITTTTLTLSYVKGPWIYGAGMNATQIKYTGTASTSSPTNVIFANGFAYGRVENMSFNTTAGNSTAANTCCFNWNWDNTIQNTTFMDFINCGFYNATYGMLVAYPSPAGFGNECDQAIWWNCHFNNCFDGLHLNQQNALEVAFFGGKISNCSNRGINGVGGYVPVVIGTVFDSNGTDIYQQNGNSYYLANCVTNSINFSVIANRLVADGCRQTATSTGIFIQTAPAVSALVENNYSEHGIIIGSGELYLHNNTFNSSLNAVSTDAVFGVGQLKEWTQNNTFTMTQINAMSTRTWAEGLQLSVSDSTSNTWGATITSSGGTNHSHIRFNGTNWTVVGK